MLSEPILPNDQNPCSLSTGKTVSSKSISIWNGSAKTLLRSRQQAVTNLVDIRSGFTQNLSHGASSQGGANGTRESKHMAGVAGWITPSGFDIEPGTILTQMNAALGAAKSDGLAVSNTHGLCAFSPFGTASIHADQGLVCALDGRVRWDGPELERIASEISPAAALLAAYRRHGKECLNRLHGNFALAVLEPASGVALLAIDRMGINRLCFATAHKGLVFGATTDSVTVHPAIGRKISEQAIFDYLFCHMVPAPGSIYAGVEKLLPAEYALFQHGTLTRGFYWEATWEDRELADFDARAADFERLLRQAVSSAAQTERIGAFLSGGTDSSTVAGMLTEASGRPAETFSIGFEAEGFDEIGFARIASRRFGTHPHEYYVTPDDVVRAIPMIAAAYDEPFGNASAVPTYFCALKAKEAGIDVMLAGDGGDEIFGGNARYAKQKIFELYWRIPAVLRSGLIEPALMNLPGARHVMPLRKAQSYVRQARIPLPDRLESYNFLHGHPLDEIFMPEFLAGIDPDNPITLMREPYFRTRSHSTINRMLHLDWKQTLADNDLRKVNRMTEFAGIEVRYPLLDERMVEFAAMLPPSYKVRGNCLRWFFKQALKDFLPPEIIAKSKHGFGLPFGLWLQEHPPLRDLACDSLAAFRQRGYLKPSYLDHLLQLHRSEHASYYGVMIWVIMLLEQWLQQHRPSGS
jgi:asparagine synthase (glutamine-hydrolysing)